MKFILPLFSIFLTMLVHGQCLYDGTFIDPTMKWQLNDSVNTIYCSSFINAWTELNDLHGGKLLLDTTTLMLDQLNSIENDNSISEGYLVAKAGYIKDSIIFCINQELTYKFNFTKSFNEKYHDNDIISYAYLNKQIEYYSPINEAFYDMKLAFNEMDSVAFFGIRTPWSNPVYRSKLIVHNYKHNDDFVLEIKTKNDQDQVFLAKVPPNSTLENSYNSIIARINLNDTSFIEFGEELKIPYLDFSIDKNFVELEDRMVLNPGFKDYRLKEVRQQIDFNLNETGISIESEGYLSEVFGIAKSSHRQFIFDKPFFIIIKEAGKLKPYFCVYIANSSFMEKL